ncbi:hypothetical protein ABWK52_19980 [Bacillus sp. AP50]
MKHPPYPQPLIEQPWYSGRISSGLEYHIKHQQSVAGLQSVVVHYRPMH